jgi:hypothetical protein
MLKKPRLDKSKKVGSNLLVHFGSWCNTINGQEKYFLRFS